MKILLVAVLASMTILPVLQSCQSASKASTAKMLRFDLEKGKGYDYDIAWEMVPGAAGGPMTMNMLGNYYLEITEDDGSSKLIAVTYGNFKMNMKMMGREINVDTEKPLAPLDPDKKEGDPSALMSHIFAGIKGKKFFMKVNGQGEITEISGYNDIANSIIDSLGIKDTGMKREELRRAISQQFNEEAVREQFARAFYIYPGKEVKVGDTWVKSYDVKGMMPGNYSTSYTVKDIDGDFVTLAAKTTISSKGEKININGDQSGVYLVESKTGLVINADITQDMSVETSGIAMAMKGKGTIKGKAR